MDSPLQTGAGWGWGCSTGSRQGPLEALRAAELELNYLVPDPCMHACGCAGGLAHRSPTRPSLIFRGSHSHGSIAARKHRLLPTSRSSLLAFCSLPRVCGVGVSSVSLPRAVGANMPFPVGTRPPLAQCEAPQGGGSRAARSRSAQRLQMPVS